MTILHTPDDILNEIEKSIFNFLWDSTDRIKRKTLIGSKANGGIKMLDIFCKNKSLKAGWVNRLANGSINSIFLNSHLNKLGIDCNYLFKTTVINPKYLARILKIPLFWAEVFAYVNQCKSVKEKAHINSNDVLSETIWFNCRYIHKKKPIFISNWAKSGIIYIKDLFDADGNFISENFVFNKLNDKRNWIAQYSLMKNKFKSLKDDYNTFYAKFINIKTNWTFTYNNRIYSIIGEKSNLFYRILIDKKFERNYMEDVWQREFNIDYHMWPAIYKNQIWITDRKVGEFKYKILCNILSNKALISKWNKDITENCDFCGQKQTTKHMLYECPRVFNIWELISTLLKVKITYKHIVIGNIEDNSYIYNRNLLITYISYSIYKFWVLSQNNLANFKNDCLLSFIKKDLFTRTIYNQDDNFKKQCDSLIKEM